MCIATESDKYLVFSHGFWGPGYDIAQKCPRPVSCGQWTRVDRRKRICCELVKWPHHHPYKVHGSELSYTLNFMDLVLGEIWLWMERGDLNARACLCPLLDLSHFWSYRIYFQNLKLTTIFLWFIRYFHWENWGFMYVNVSCKIHQLKISASIYQGWIDV